MTKQEFFAQLREKLSGAPQGEIEDRLIFYGEMIDDRIEEGMSEEDAVAAVGDIDAIVSDIISDIPLASLVKEKKRTKRKMKAWEITLLAVGSPIWLSLLAAAFAVALSLYVVIWSIVITLWASGAAIAGVSLATVVILVLNCVYGSVWTGLAFLGAGLVLAGISIFWFFGCKALTKCVVLLTKKIVLWIKKLFVRKGDKQ